MLPKVFLSLSGVDDNFVDEVHAQLPQGLAYFYRKSFSTGENLITAMEERLKETSIFVLFASSASLKSKWVGFEIDRARIAHITRPEFRCIVVPVGNDVAHKDLPPWMQEFWTGSAGNTPRDVARYIQGILSEHAEHTVSALRPFGRGAVIDKAQRDIQLSLFEKKVAPNVLLFAGNGGIGRRTVSRSLMKAAFPAQPSLVFGPELVLPQFADILDLYRATRRELERNFSADKFLEDEAVFLGLSQEAQIAEIVGSFRHFSQLGQAITVVTENGLFEDKGYLKSWVYQLFQALSARQDMMLICVTNRLLHEKERAEHDNVLQFRVDELPTPEIKAIIIASTAMHGATPQLPNDGIIQAIGGHPSVARATARLLAQKGAGIVNNNPKDVFDIQDRTLSVTLGFENLTDIQKETLSILSWVQRLNGGMLEDVIRDRHSVSEEEFAEILGDLIVSCLIQVSGSDYLISPPIRSVFRRKFGYGAPELRRSFAGRLKAEWDKSQAIGQFSFELFDTFVHMTALEGGTLPPEFGKLLSPATLQEVVKEGYDNRHIDEAGLDRAISWGLPAKDIPMDETVREEILSYVLRAQIRKNDVSGAKETLEYMKKRSYRSQFYLEALIIRLTGGDLEVALKLLRSAKTAKKYMNSVIADTAICMKSLGRWAELSKLIDAETKRVYSNASLLDIKIGMSIAKGRFSEAEADIAVLRAMPYEDGRADARQAAILLNRDKDHDAAYKLLTTLLSRQSKGAASVRKLRAVVSARVGSAKAARDDVEFFKSKPEWHDFHHRIEAEIKLKVRDFDGAEMSRKAIKNKNARDELLEAKIMESRAVDISTPLRDREGLLNKAAIIRRNLSSVDEFDL
ncbi:toll/interleukin-1 receptor domain-containing protein [Rhizobium pisi]|uniref:toll/interleukin-1 receptor domain-containing protein n=1 Tax=Rhizobium pisi TaxID=574561 RepID=UPI0039B01730